jgi:hypothetical protein
MLQVGFEPPTLQRSVHITMCVFNFSIPLVDLCFFLSMYGRKYSMKVNLFMENMWEFFLVFYFVPYKVSIPMHAGEFFKGFFCSIHS